MSLLQQLSQALKSSGLDASVNDGKLTIQYGPSNTEVDTLLATRLDDGLLYSPGIPGDPFKATECDIRNWLDNQNVRLRLRVLRDLTHKNSLNNY